MMSLLPCQKGSQNENKYQTHIDACRVLVTMAVCVKLGKDIVMEATVCMVGHVSSIQPTIRGGASVRKVSVAGGFFCYI